MAEIICGKTVSAAKRLEIKKRVEELKNKGISTGLAVIIVGNNSASRVYVNNKKKACEEVGIESFEYALPEETTQEELLELIVKLNNDDKVDGILCQLPLPSHIDEQAVINSIDPKKDVDAFHPENVGHIMIGDYTFLPCTPAGIMEMLKFYNIDVKGKKCVVIGRSNIVGKPMAMLLLKENGTVEICHSRTVNLKDETLTADILVAAVGKAYFVTADMAKDGAVVIDVGMNRNEEGKLCGDVDFESVKEKELFLKLITVSGVGPKLGIAVLASLSADEFAQVIATADVKRLSAVKGLGKKTAEKIVLELHGKISAAEVLGASGESVGAETAQPTAKATPQEEEAISALMGLGFTRTESAQAVKKAKDLGAKTVEEIIMKALQGV